MPFPQRIFFEAKSFEKDQKDSSLKFKSEVDLILSQQAAQHQIHTTLKAI